MKLLVEMLVNGQTEWEVVEAENAPQAINQSRVGFSFDENGELVVNDDEISYTGVFEICETNLLGFLAKEAEIHRFYHKKLEKLGINPLTFENSQEIAI
ncbi:type III secretion system protein PrgG [Enterococcus faecalis]|uniref:type III secretion system protein PrgG n=1 Tax=Enterococcus faecalis TaxID=1351 RepID=UPI0019DBE33B|nr:type III secretion system protein PrgG [Enterococcus faecalis]EGO2587839.1 type III secretion system protein PrgG [Enterococcus faecalis]EGO5066691.1 type III secretion system protein PrgG [Enterococcus faecalis]EGO5077133.1 type III secretion system protein PrgG [Enterococcus faecalis]EHV2892145.1 type III secretion system protein PrgG [Enterococcus faecalis]MDN3136297.1 type III secretion system protein PrgG [Enterococcus faecalis]